MPKFVHSACLTSKYFRLRNAIPRVSKCKQGGAQAGYKLCTALLVAVHVFNMPTLPIILEYNYMNCITRTVMINEQLHLFHIIINSLNFPTTGLYKIIGFWPIPGFADFDYFIFDEISYNFQDFMESNNCFS